MKHLNPLTRGARRRGLVAGALASVLLLALAACGSGSDDDPGNADGPTEAKPATVKMAVVPAATFAPVFVGLDQDIFAKHGIDLKIDVGGLAPTVFPRILSGDVDMGANTWGTLVTARAQGLPLVGIAPVDQGGTTPEDDYQAIVAAKGGATDLKGLEGKTIGVPSLKSFTDSQVRSVLIENGVDVSKINFIAMGFPDMPAALSSKKVDAVGVVEPFFSQIKAQGGNPLISLSRGQLMGSIVASEKFVSQKPEVVKAFQAAWLETLEYAEEHEDEVRKALVEGLGLPEEVAGAITLPIWTTSVTEAQVQEISDMMSDVGAVEKKVEAKDLMTDFPLKD